MRAQATMRPPATSVVMIASSLRRSRMIPTMPKIKAAGNENIISNAPSAAKGLPQPGLHRRARTNVAPAMPSRAADIFPKRIFQSSRKRQIRVPINPVYQLSFDFSTAGFQIPGITGASRHADAVEVIEQGDGELSGRIEKVFELHAFETAFLIDI